MGGFRPESPNFVGGDQIANAQEAFASAGLELTPVGELRRRLLPALDGPETPDVLRQYARRAVRGSQDAALVAGTGKDLLEATTGYVLLATYGSYDEQVGFRMLLGQAFAALELATPATPKESRRGRLARRRATAIPGGVRDKSTAEQGGYGSWSTLPSVGVRRGCGRGNANHGNAGPASPRPSTSAGPLRRWEEIHECVSE